MEEMGVVRGQGGRPCSEEQLLQDRAAGSAGLTGCTERSHKEKSPIAMDCLFPDTIEVDPVGGLHD